jgi:hypothetical protein
MNDKELLQQWFKESFPAYSDLIFLNCDFCFVLSKPSLAISFSGTEKVKQKLEKSGFKVLTYDDNTRNQITGFFASDNSSERIKQSLMGALELTDELVNKRTRKREICGRRQVLHFCMKIYTNLSLAQIGLTCGVLDHATVLNSCRSVTNLLETDCTYRAKYLNIISNAGLDIEKVKILLKEQKEKKAPATIYGDLRGTFPNVRV